MLGASCPATFLAPASDPYLQSALQIKFGSLQLKPGSLHLSPGFFFLSLAVYNLSLVVYKSSLAFYNSSLALYNSRLALYNSSLALYNPSLVLSSKDLFMSQAMWIKNTSHPHLISLSSAVPLIHDSYDRDRFLAAYRNPVSLHIHVACVLCFKLCTGYMVGRSTIHQKPQFPASLGFGHGKVIVRYIIMSPLPESHIIDDSSVVTMQRLDRSTILHDA